MRKVPIKPDPNEHKVGTYEIKETADGRFYPGMWVRRYEKTGWFKVEIHVGFEYLTITGLPWGYHQHSGVIPPTAGPYGSLESARRFIRDIQAKRQSVPAGKSKFHSAYSKGDTIIVEPNYVKTGPL